MKRNPWPVLRTYDQNHLARIALPLGGIGTGTVSLGGRGDLRDWEIMNRPAKGFLPAWAPYVSNVAPPVFVLCAQPDGAPAVTRALEGPLEVAEYEGPRGCRSGNHGLPRFRRASFAAAYPFGQVMLSDPAVPVAVRLEAFNPLIPGNADDSGIPIAVLRYVFTNKTGHRVTVSVCGNVPNCIGSDGSATTRVWGDVDLPTGTKDNRNTYRQSATLRGIFMDSHGVDPQSERWGTIALATTAATGITYRTAWATLSWGDSVLDFWDDFSADGEVEDRPKDPGDDAPVASLAVKLNVGPRQTKAVTFLLAWHFPNRQGWSPMSAVDQDPANIVGNYYSTRYTDAWDVAEKTAPQLDRLERDTITFVSAFCQSDLPLAVKEAALFNLSTLRTQTCFRTADGRFFAWEGSHDHSGSCPGSCTHVWNYEQATAFLFGDLARSMREVEFAHATHDNGLMSFRVNLPLSQAQGFPFAAADGQMGCLMKLYRDWQLSGDDAMLRALWPHARRALEFCWVPGGWDADRDGVMEGCQHNTMDVEYFGPNPQMQGWYLGALRAAEEMAQAVGEPDFAATCRYLFERGRAWTDAQLFNGEYYEHEIRVPKDADAIAPGLRVGMGAGLDELQLGAGCLVDQLVGQYMAHVCGLGYLHDRRHVQQTLRAIMRHNFRRGFHGHFNHLRSFVLGDESALLMATYPRGRRPQRPFPYYNEVMTGFEYTAAAGMLYEGLRRHGLRCIAAIRSRYDGRKRNPFNEAECGHHYGRAMASWATLLALTGFHYSAVTGTIAFAPARNPVTWFWSNGSAWGTCRQVPARGKIRVELRVLHGQLRARRLVLTGFGAVDIKGGALGGGCVLLVPRHSAPSTERTSLSRQNAIFGSLDGLPPDLSARKKAYLKVTGYGSKRTG
jgi:non-lysosomal glucosylceramidase